MAEKNANDSPPLFGSWKGWYATVLGSLAVLIFLFYLFMKVFQ